MCGQDLPPLTSTKVPPIAAIRRRLCRLTSNESKNSRTHIAHG
jgi:hypothetical protein